MIDADAFSSVASWVEAVRSKKVSARELLEFHLFRVAAFNPPLNAIIALMPEQARKRADAADAALARGDVWGPLHGIPMTIKDTFDVSGTATTFGIKDMRENMAHANAVAVQRLVDAGVIIFGKTNVPEGAADYQTYNEIFGTTNNPWDLRRGAGGSSGGAAAAVAAGLTPMELGSDRGGSLRNPAHYCGIYAHKPTYGIVPMRGGATSGWISPADFTVAGPLARTADDLELALDVIAGADPMLMTGWTLNLPKPTRSALRDFRIAAWLDDKSCPVDSTVLDRLTGLVETLRQAGARVDETARPAFDSESAYHLYMRILRAGSTARLPDAKFEALAAQAAALSSDDHRYSAHAVRGAAMRHRDFVIANNQRAHFQRRWLEFFEDFDILLAPIEQTPAFLHNHEPDRDKRFHVINGRQWPYGDHGFFSGMPSLANLPTTVAPVGLTPDGLPVGVQIIGREYADHMTIRFAKLLAAEIGGFQAPPMFRS